MDSFINGFKKQLRIIISMHFISKSQGHFTRTRYKNKKKQKSSRNHKKRSKIKEEEKVDVFVAIFVWECFKSLSR